MAMRRVLPIWLTDYGRVSAPEVNRVDYDVVMSQPVSVRFRDQRVAERLRLESATRGRSNSALAEELIDEGLRQRRHPLVTFRDGVAGRRPALIGGPDLAEVVDGIVGGDVLPVARVERASELFGLRRAEVDAVLAYYAEFADEIDDEIAANRRVASEAEARWRRQNDLLAR